MKQRLCMIGTQFLGVPALNGGAIEYLSFRIAEGLAGKDFKITFFSVDPSLKFYSENIVVERFPAKKTNALFFTLFVVLKSFGKEFDAVYVSGCSMIFAGFILSKLKGIPLIYHEFNHNPWIKPKNIVYDFLAELSVNISDYVIASGSFIKNKISERIRNNKNKLIEISNFADISEFSNVLKKKEKKILFVGRAVKHKGIDFLLELCEKDFNEWLFVFVCPEPLSPEEKFFSDKIKKTAESKASVVFKQGLSRKKLLQEFSSASVFVLPSSEEAFGLVLIEAMASFVPCVAFSTGGTPEIIDDSINGFLVPLNENELFEKRLRELIINEKKRFSFGLNARKKVEEKFSFGSAVKKFESFFRKIMVKE